MPSHVPPLAALPVALGVAALALPSPENVTAFLSAVGIGVGIGVAFYIGHVGKARVKAFQEYDAAFKQSSLARAQSAERLRDEMVVQVQANTDEIRQLKEELVEKTHAAEVALMNLAEQSIKILTDYGYVVRHRAEAETEAETEGAGSDAPPQAPDADRRG